MNTTKPINNDAKKIFKEKGTCSRTFEYILNREFGNVMADEERAADPFAGGIMRKGHQCGMLWGTTLAIGAEAYRRTNDLDKASAMAISATQTMMDSFEKRTKSVNCKDITGCSMDNFFGMAKFMVKVTLQGMNNSTCFKLAENWYEDAIQSAKEGLVEDQNNIPTNTMNCASEIVRRLGGTDEEIAMVAGFAGGMGLRGHGCGALSAAIWSRSLEWVKNNPGKSAYNTQEAKGILKVFLNETQGEMICSKICVREFESVFEHSGYIKNGGCSGIIQSLSIKS